MQISIYFRTAASAQKNQFMSCTTYIVYSRHYYAGCNYFWGVCVSRTHRSQCPLWETPPLEQSVGKKVRQFVSSIDSNLLKIIFIPSDFITLGLLLQTRKKFAIIIQVIGKVNCLLGQSADDKPQYIFFPPRPYTSSILILLLHSPEYIYILGEQSRSESTRHYRKCVEFLAYAKSKAFKKAALAALYRRAERPAA